MRWASKPPNSNFRVSGLFQKMALADDASAPETEDRADARQRGNDRYDGEEIRGLLWGAGRGGDLMESGSPAKRVLWVPLGHYLTFHHPVGWKDMA